MHKISDRLVLSAVASLVGAWPSRLLGHLLYQLKVIDFDFTKLGSGMFLDQEAAQTNTGKLTGIAVTEINNLIASAVLTYTLAITGRDKAVLKGMGIGAGMWVLVNGLLSGSVLRKKSNNAWAPLYTLLHHILSGGLSAFVIAQMGDDSLFPDAKIDSPGEKLPVLSMWQTAN